MLRLYSEAAFSRCQSCRYSISSFYHQRQNGIVKGVLERQSGGRSSHRGTEGWRNHYRPAAQLFLIYHIIHFSVITYYVVNIFHALRWALAPNACRVCLLLKKAVQAIPYMQISGACTPGLCFRDHICTIRNWQPAAARPFTDLPTAYKIACKKGPTCFSILENNHLNYYKNLLGGLNVNYTDRKAGSRVQWRQKRQTPICSSHQAIEDMPKYTQWAK